MKLSDVMKVWEIVHTQDTGSVGFCDVERAIDMVVGIENDIPSEQPEYESIQDLLEMAWVIIANAYGGDWDLASEASGWKRAAERWRDVYHKTLSTPAAEDSLIDISSETSLPVVDKT